MQATSPLGDVKETAEAVNGQKGEEDIGQQQRANLPAESHDLVAFNTRQQSAVLHNLAKSLFSFSSILCAQQQQVHRVLAGEPVSEQTAKDEGGHKDDQQDTAVGDWPEDAREDEVEPQGGVGVQLKVIRRCDDQSVDDDVQHHQVWNTVVDVY